MCTTLSEGEKGLTMNLNVKYVKPMFGNLLYGKSEVIKKGKTVYMAIGRIIDETGEIIAVGTARFMIKEINKLTVWS